jgi:hypothetical protein
MTYLGRNTKTGARIQSHTGDLVDSEWESENRITPCGKITPRKRPGVVMRWFRWWHAVSQIAGRKAANAFGVGVL